MRVIISEHGGAFPNSRGQDTIRKRRCGQKNEKAQGRCHSRGPIFCTTGSTLAASASSLAVTVAAARRGFAFSFFAVFALSFAAFTSASADFVLSLGVGSCTFSATFSETGGGVSGVWLGAPIFVRNLSSIRSLMPNFSCSAKTGWPWNGEAFTYAAKSGY